MSILSYMFLFLKILWKGDSSFLGKLKITFYAFTRTPEQWRDAYTATQNYSGREDDMSPARAWLGKE